MTDKKENIESEVNNTVDYRTIKKYAKLNSVENERYEQLKRQSGFTKDSDYIRFKICPPPGYELKAKKGKFDQQAINAIIAELSAVRSEMAHIKTEINQTLKHANAERKIGIGLQDDRADKLIELNEPRMAQLDQMEQLLLKIYKELTVK